MCFINVPICTPRDRQAKDAVDHLIPFSMSLGRNVGTYMSKKARPCTRSGDTSYKCRHHQMQREPDAVTVAASDFALEKISPLLPRTSSPYR